MDLKKIREDNNMTQLELATKIGKDRSLITKIESGDSLPSVGTAKAIGYVLGFDWTLFFEDVGEKFSHDEEEE